MKHIFYMGKAQAVPGPGFLEAALGAQGGGAAPARVGHGSWPAHAKGYVFDMHMQIIVYFIILSNIILYHPMLSLGIDTVLSSIGDAIVVLGTPYLFLASARNKSEEKYRAT